MESIKKMKLSFLLFKKYTLIVQIRWTHQKQKQKKRKKEEMKIIFHKNDNTFCNFIFNRIIIIEIEI
jgi:hypothetical protein